MTRGGAKTQPSVDMDQNERQASGAEGRRPDTGPAAGSGCGHRPAGLSTVELLLVVAMLGILAGLTLPRFGGEQLPYERVTTTAQNLAGHLRLARRLAISGGIDHRLIFKPSAPPFTSYSIEKKSAGWTLVRGPFSIPDSVSCTGDRLHRFTRLGNAAASTKVTLTQTTTSRTVRVLAATGRSWVGP